MTDNTVYLAIRDWLHEASLSMCAVLALASILSPLLILHGVHTGVVERMRERLLLDPQVLVLMPLGSNGAGFTQAELDKLKAQPSCSFIIGRTRDVASELALESQGGEHLTISLEPTAKGDPLLTRFHLSPPLASPEKFEIVLSQSAASRLKVAAKEQISAKLARRLSTGRLERFELKLVISAILPAEAMGMDLGFLDQKLLLAIQDYRDGYACPLFGVPGEALPKKERYFESFRAYAPNLEAVEDFEEWCKSENLAIKTRAKDIAAIKNIDRTLSAIILVISVTTAAGFFAFMVSTLHASIRRKWKMLGMLRLIGFSRLGILVYPVTQALTTGLLGVLLSFLVYGCIATCIDLLFATQAGGEAICVVHPKDFVLIAIFVQVLIQVASWKISLKASRIDPSLAIRES
ncbi:MAG: hypothetical protein IJS50_02575 [Desulfovibrio sp.]|nr:hypothetical protein [Desulfovibrio sp.]